MTKHATTLSLVVALALVPGLLPGGDALARNPELFRGCGDVSPTLGKDCCAAATCCVSPSVPAGVTATKVTSANSTSMAQPTGVVATPTRRPRRSVAPVAPSSPVPTGSSPPSWGVLLC